MMKLTSSLLLLTLLSTAAIAAAPAPTTPAPAPALSAPTTVTEVPVASSAPAAVIAPAGSPGHQGYAAVKKCVMENSPAYCKSQLTPASQDMFSRFLSYKLMPCLPTDFQYENEIHSGNRTEVKMRSVPTPNQQQYIMRMVFIETDGKQLLDLPATFERGFGPKWENKIQLSEQLYLMMRQNMGDKLNCDMLNGLLVKK